MTVILNEKPTFDTKKGDGKKPKLVHQPIMIEKEDFELAYICEDVNDDKNDSFLVLLTKYNGDRKYPKLIKFTKDGNYWKVP